jgi:threonine dehydrogenase-like Zn-dependent dehydrogenase
MFQQQNPFDGVKTVAVSVRGQPPNSVCTTQRHEDMRARAKQGMEFAFSSPHDRHAKRALNASGSHRRQVDLANTRTGTHAAFALEQARNATSHLATSSTATSRRGILSRTTNWTRLFGSSHEKSGNCGAHSMRV